MKNESEQINVNITPPLKRWTQWSRIRICLAALSLMVFGGSCIYRSVTGFRLSGQYSPTESEAKIKALRAELAEVNRAASRCSRLARQTASIAEIARRTPEDEERMEEEYNRAIGDGVWVKYELRLEESSAKKTQEARNSIPSHIFFGVVGAITAAVGLLGVWVGIFRPDRIRRVWVLVPTKQTAADGDGTG